MNYSLQIKTKEWQLKRQLILERDNFECQMCMNRENLVVHHKKYLSGLMAWQYEDRFLITICKDCHDSHHYAKKIDHGIKYTKINITPFKIKDDKRRRVRKKEPRIMDDGGPPVGPKFFHKLGSWGKNW